MISTRAIARVVLATFVLSLGFALAGCEDTKLMELFDTKKKLPGERKEVFPGGQVPGVQFGVPPELMKGNRDAAAAQGGEASGTPPAPGAPDAAPPPDATAAAPPAAPEPERREAAKPKSKPKPKKVAQPKPKPAPRPATAPSGEAQPPSSSAQQPDNGPPPPSGGLLPWPGDTTPPANRFSR